jgi:hypothetical protein
LLRHDEANNSTFAAQTIYIMKKITILLLTFFASWYSNAQFGCDSAVVLNNGYTASGITTPGNAGPEDWNTNPTDTAPTSGLYWDDDVYLFQYTAGPTAEEISMTIFSVNSWNGIGIFSTCTGTTFSGMLAAQGTTGANSTKTVTANIAPNQTVYIAVGQWGTPDGLNFNVTSFSALSLVNPPNCTTLLTPANGATSISSSVITWTAATGGATSYKLNVGTSSGATDFLTGLNVGNVLSYNLGNLAAGATYYVTVIASNANGDATACTESSFTTCGTLSPDLIETFTTFLPGCWTNVFGGDLLTGPTAATGSGWGADGFGNVGMTGAIRNNIFTTGANDWFISPLINIPATGYELKFDAAATQYNATTLPTTPWAADDFIQVLVSSTGTTNWTVLYTYDSTNQPLNTGSTLVLDLDAYAGQTVRFAFRAVEGQTDDVADIDFSIDNFEVRLIPSSIPDCASNVVGTPNATCGNFANVITWSAASGADGYRISIGTTEGGVEVANNLLIGNVLTYSFTGTIATTYYYTVVPFNISGPATGCTEMSFTTNVNGCYCISLPTSNDGDGITNVQIGTTDFPTTDVTYFDHTATVVDMTQGISNNVQISFATGFNYNTYILIDFNNDFDFTDAGEVVYAGVSLPPNPTTLNASFVMPVAAPIGQHRMRIVTADDLETVDACYSDTYGVTLDFTINILPAPACIPPTALSVANITATSANLAWTENGTATVWAIEWGIAGFTTTGTPNIPIATNPQNLPGLTQNTAYSFYVRAVCSSTESAWVGPFTFTTTCVAADVPFTQDFESAVIPALPNCGSQENVGAGNLWTVSNNGTDYGFTTQALTYTWNSANAADVWFYTQGINLTGGTAYKISYDYGSTGITFPEKLKVAYGTSASSSAMTNVLVDHGEVVNNPGINSLTEFTPATSGVYYFGFNAYSDADQFYLFVDNITVDVALSSSTFDSSSFVAFPNPVKNILNLSYNQSISQVEIFNLLGQKMTSDSFTTTTAEIDMSGYASGAYLVKVTSNNATKTIRVIKE